MAPRGFRVIAFRRNAEFRGAADWNLLFFARSRGAKPNSLERQPKQLRGDARRKLAVLLAARGGSLTKRPKKKFRARSSSSAESDSWTRFELEDEKARFLRGSVLFGIENSRGMLMFG